ncbi:MAG TPA: HAD family hydrolase [Candidatus Sulfotelmatobacter sp.]|nr:HAD family hydrolase [Candidatus Sulfotelmatobacter sp.]
MAKSAVFVDRDDTLIVDVGYCKDPDRIQLLPGVVEGLRKLSRAGIAIVVITNQSGIGRGFFTEDDLSAVHARLRTELEASGVTLQAIYYCPHLPEDGCSCRKPRPGLLLKAASEMDLNLKNCFMIGDRKLDLLAGRAAGTHTILVFNKDRRELTDMEPIADFVVKDLVEAANVILNRSKTPSVREDFGNSNWSESP